MQERYAQEPEAPVFRFNSRSFRYRRQLVSLNNKDLLTYDLDGNTLTVRLTLAGFDVLRTRQSQGEEDQR